MAKRLKPAWGFGGRHTLQLMLETLEHTAERHADKGGGHATQAVIKDMRERAADASEMLEYPEMPPGSASVEIITNLLDWVRDVDMLEHRNPELRYLARKIRNTLNGEIDRGIEHARAGYRAAIDELRQTDPDNASLLDNDLRQWDTAMAIQRTRVENLAAHPVPAARRREMSDNLFGVRRAPPYLRWSFYQRMSPREPGGIQPVGSVSPPASRSLDAAMARRILNPADHGQAFPSEGELFGPRFNHWFDIDGLWERLRVRGPYFRTAREIFARTENALARETAIRLGRSGYMSAQEHGAAYVGSLDRESGESWLGNSYYRSVDDLYGEDPLTNQPRTAPQPAPSPVVANNPSMGMPLPASVPQPVSIPPVAVPANVDPLDPPLVVPARRWFPPGTLVGDMIDSPGDTLSMVRLAASDAADRFSSNVVTPFINSITPQNIMDGVSSSVRSAIAAADESLLPREPRWAALPPGLAAARGGVHVRSSQPLPPDGEKNDDPDDIDTGDGDDRGRDGNDASRPPSAEPARFDRHGLGGLGDFVSLALRGIIRAVGVPTVDMDHSNFDASVVTEPSAVQRLMRPEPPHHEMRSDVALLVNSLSEVRVRRCV